MMKFAGSLNGLEYHSARADACVRGRGAREGVSSGGSTRPPAERVARDVSASTVCRRPARKIVLAERRAGDTLRARPTQPALFLTPESKAKSNLRGRVAGVEGTGKAAGVEGTGKAVAEGGDQ